LPAGVVGCHGVAGRCTINVIEDIAGAAGSTIYVCLNGGTRKRHNRALIITTRKVRNRQGGGDHAGSGEAG